MGRSFIIVAVALTGCGLFPDLSTLGGGDASVDASVDASAYADVRIPCEQRPCIGQNGEICCWFNGAQDTCVAADACAGFATLECYGSVQCLAVGKTTCCAFSNKTVCTDEATCGAQNGTPLCDVTGDAGLTGDPNDTTCAGSTKCNGTTTFEGYTFRSCK